MQKSNFCSEAFTSFPVNVLYVFSVIQRGVALSSSWQLHPPSVFYFCSFFYLIQDRDLSLPQVVMAGEQEVNQRSVISPPASGSKGTSNVGAHANQGTRPTAGPASLWSLPLCQVKVTLLVFVIACAATYVMYFSNFLPIECWCFPINYYPMLAGEAKVKPLRPNKTILTLKCLLTLQHK